MSHPRRIIGISLLALALLLVLGAAIPALAQEPTGGPRRVYLPELVRGGPVTPPPPTPTATSPALQPPAAPTNLTTSQITTSGVLLSWQDNSSNESGFYVERAIGSGAFAADRTLGANTTTVQITGLSPSTTYRFRVRAYNGAGPSAYTNVVSVTTQGLTILRVRNNTSYPIVYLTVDGTQKLPSSPMAILPGQYADYPIAAGNHSLLAMNGHWDTQANQRFTMYQFTGSWYQAAGQTYTMDINNPTIGQLLTKFHQAGTAYYEGIYFNGTTGGVAGFWCDVNGNWRLYDNGYQIASGTYWETGRDPNQYAVFFQAGYSSENAGTYSELQGCFYMPNGPASWRVITYTYQGTSR